MASIDPPIIWPIHRGDKSQFLLHLDSFGGSSGVGFVAIGQCGEDLCLTDPPAATGSYHREGRRFFPSMTCMYRFADGSVASVEHAWYTSARSA